MPALTERDLLQEMVPDLEADGYDVYISPARSLLPSFLKEHAPDAIALRSDKNLAIEVVRKLGPSKKNLQQLAELFKGQQKWDLRVLYLDSTASAEALPVQSAQAVSERMAELRRLIDEGHLRTSLLLGWATFEAIARSAVTERFARPQTPGRVVEVLATEGLVTPSEADALRALVRKRNRFVHGELEVEVAAAEMLQFVDILEAVRRQPAN